MYALNQTELDELRKWLKGMTDMSAVGPAKSSCSSPILFVPKGHGRGSRRVSKIDLEDGYNLIRIKADNERKISFRCRYGLYEYTVMPFGLVNAPATFQATMNTIFRDILDEGTLEFMDDIMVHAAECTEHVRILLEVL